MATYTLKQLTEILKCSDITIRRCFKSNSDEFSVILPSNSKQGQKKYYSQAVLDLLKEKLNIDVLTEQEDTLQLLETQGGNENQCTAPLKDKEEENTVIRLLQEQVEELREQLKIKDEQIRREQEIAGNALLELSKEREEKILLLGDGKKQKSIFSRIFGKKED